MLYLYMSACVADGMKSRSLGRTWKQYVSRLLPGLIYFEKPVPAHSKYFSEQGGSDLPAPPLAVQTHLGTKQKMRLEGQGLHLQHICNLHRASPSFATVSDYFLTQINRRWPTPDMKKTCKNCCYTHRAHPQSLSSSTLPPKRKNPKRSLITYLYPASPFLLSFTLQNLPEIILE